MTSKGWFKPWHPWVVGLFITLLTLAGSIGATNYKVAANCAQFEKVEEEMGDIRGDVSETREDVSYIRGVIETEFGGDNE